MNEDLELMMSEIPAETTMADVEEYLCHYGTSGMKWGKRLYQNLDGSLTPLGRLRYGVQYKNIGQVEARRKAKAASKKEKDEKKEKSRSETIESVIRSGNAKAIYENQKSMTDDELRRAISRLENVSKIKETIRKEKNTPLDEQQAFVMKCITDGGKALESILKIYKAADKAGLTNRR